MNKNRTLPHPKSKNSQRKALRGSTYGNAYHLASIERKKVEAEERRKYWEQWDRDHPEAKGRPRMPHLALDLISLQYGVSPLSTLAGLRPIPPEEEARILEVGKKFFSDFLDGIE